MSVDTDAFDAGMVARIEADIDDALAKAKTLST